MKALILVAVLALAACGDEGSVRADAKQAPPLEQMVEEPGDWSALFPAVGKRPVESAMLTRGPLVTDLNALLGDDAKIFRDRMAAAGGQLHDEAGVLVSATPPGAEAAYLIVDMRARSMEAGMRTASGWRVKRTPGAALPTPPSIAALRRS